MNRSIKGKRAYTTGRFMGNLTVKATWCGNKWSELHPKKLRALKVSVRQRCSLQCVCAIDDLVHIKVC